MGDSGQGPCHRLANGALAVGDDTADGHGHSLTHLGHQRLEILGGCGEEAARQHHLAGEAVTQHPQDFVADIGLQAVDGLSGEVVLARSLLSATTEDLQALVTEVRQAVPVPIRGVISDGQSTIRKAVARALPGVPHQLCQFHYLREAAQPIYEADRHAKKELKKRVRGVRPLERQAEKEPSQEAAVVRDYCAAVRAALTDDGRPPLAASGLRLLERLTKVVASLDRVAAKAGRLLKGLEKLRRLLHRGLEQT